MSESMALMSLLAGLGGPYGGVGATGMAAAQDPRVAQMMFGGALTNGQPALAPFGQAAPTDALLAATGAPPGSDLAAHLAMGDPGPQGLAAGPGGAAPLTSNVPPQGGLPGQQGGLDPRILQALGGLGRAQPGPQQAGALPMASVPGRGMPGGMLPGNLLPRR